MVKFIAASIFGLFFSGAVCSAPLYYTFQGQVSNVTLDSAGIIADTYNLSDYRDFKGTPVEYVFLVDTDQAGSYTQNDNVVVIQNDFSNSDTILDYFYSDFVSGSLIADKNGGSFNSPTDVKESNTGISRNDLSSANDDVALLSGESASELTEVKKPALFAQWIVGTTGYQGVEKAYDENGKLSAFTADLTLISISETLNPIPVPAAAWLFGTALIGLIGFSKRRKMA